MALNTNEFVTQLTSHNYTHICVVPCSFAKNLINASINNDAIEYMPCASEAVACSVAAGLKTAGRKPIVVVQSSGITNMGSCITSLLKPYNINFPIIVSWRTYKEGDSEIQHKHLATRLPDLIDSYGYDYEVLSQNDICVVMNQINSCNDNAKICILQKDAFDAVKLDAHHQIDVSKYTVRSDFLKMLNNQFKESLTVFIGTTGNTAREMYTFMPDTHNFYMAGNMGGALSLGVGLALAGKKVIVCGGDAEFVMHMGGLTTAGRYQNLDLTYIVFDNEQNKSTGGQNTYQEHIDYIKIAQGSNLKVCEKTIIELNEFSEHIIHGNQGLNFMHVKCSLDKVSPRPPIDIVQKNHI